MRARKVRERQPLSGETNASIDALIDEGEGDMSMFTRQNLSLCLG